MNENVVMEIGQQAIWVIIETAAPAMLVALVVGLAISLLQALTQIQEMTLTFVPKILTMFMALVIAMPFMLATLAGFTEELYARIAGLGPGL
ncbi:MAG: flagellar biosynthesis protein FliQ [Geminicoccaceae bacterium]|nr:flagellar biosynthesis protein FliQ [Geminicoccaceae bacterium]MCB9942356.1 flagellar biosynthesis protein FliQ [Geminicoccaceae bacterium]